MGKMFRSTGGEVYAISVLNRRRPHGGALIANGGAAVVAGAPANAASRPSAVHLRPGYICIQGVATNGNGGRLKHQPLAVYIHSPGNRGVIAQVKTGRHGGFHVFVKFGGSPGVWFAYTSCPCP